MAQNQRQIYCIPPRCLLKNLQQRDVQQPPHNVSSQIAAAYGKNVRQRIQSQSQKVT